MFFLPGAVLFQLPAVNDIAVEDKFLARVISQKFGSLFGFRSSRAQMNIREHDCSELRT